MTGFGTRILVRVSGRRSELNVGQRLPLATEDSIPARAQGCRRSARYNLRQPGFSTNSADCGTYHAPAVTYGLSSSTNFVSYRPSRNAGAPRMR